MVSIYTYSKGTVEQFVGAHSCNIRLWKFSSCLGHKLWRGKNIRLPLLQKFLRERCLLCHPVSVAPEAVTEGLGFRCVTLTLIKPPKLG